MTAAASTAAGSTAAGSTAAGSPELENLGRLMLAFRGATVPAWLRERLAAAPVAGFTLFRPHNVRSPAQVRRLTAALQAAAVAGARGRGGMAGEPGGLPILIAADQEGGQLLALGSVAGSQGDWTPFAGPMAIGATADAGLAERVGRAIGLELRAVGVNVNYAPVLDLAVSPGNPSLGIRSFGDDPTEVARIAAAWLRGLQSAGVAGTGKHYPGKGGASVDTHHELAVVDRTRAAMDAAELVPFRALIEAGLRVVMSGHFAAPAVTGAASVPATLSRAAMTELLRDEQGFDGVTTTDALDMKALPQDARQAVDVTAALQAGVDLLLVTADRRSQARIESAVRRAVELRLVDASWYGRSLDRIRRLREWVAAFEDPPLDVVGSPEHRELAAELAARALTLVRDDDGLLPLHASPEHRILAVMPEPKDLTPADTSSYVRPTLGAALRDHGVTVDEAITSHLPSTAEISALRARADGYDAIVAGTISATAGSPQADLIRGLIATGRPVVTVALRTPWDLAAYPEAGTHVCTYSILPESMTALAAALFGRTAGGAPPFPGRLPVRVANAEARA